MSSGLPALHSRWVLELAETVFREQGIVCINGPCSAYLKPSDFTPNRRVAPRACGSTVTGRPISISFQIGVSAALKYQFSCVAKKMYTKHKPGNLSHISADCGQAHSILLDELSTFFHGEVAGGLTPLVEKQIAKGEAI